MALVIVATDDLDGLFSYAEDTDVFVKAGIVLGGPVFGLELYETGHDVTVQGAIVGAHTGAALGFSNSQVNNCSLSITESGLVSGRDAVLQNGSGSHTVNNGHIMGQSTGLGLYGSQGASTIENFGLISAVKDAVSVTEPFKQSVTLRNTGEIAGGDYAYVGGGGLDTIINRGVIDGRILLGSGNDIYKGSRGELEGSINGGSGLDQIICGDDDNVISGGLDSDLLRGGAGEDQFYFNSALGPSNIDTIRDFRAVDDRIQLSNDFFTQIVGTGTLSSAQFAANASGVATQSDDRIIYETDTGRLLYDSNGSAAGGARQFAILSDRPAVTAADFFVY